MRGALRDLHEVRQGDRYADRGDQRRQAEGAAQGPIGDALDRPSHSEVSAMAMISTMQERKPDRGDAEPGRQDQEEDQSDERGEHEDVAVGEVHHADDAEDHRIADGDEPVDGAERQPVDELLQKIIHVPPRSHAPADAKQPRETRASGAPFEAAIVGRVESCGQLAALCVAGWTRLSARVRRRYGC